MSKIARVPGGRNQHQHQHRSYKKKGKTGLRLKSCAGSRWSPTKGSHAGKMQYLLPLIQIRKDAGAGLCSRLILR